MPIQTFQNKKLTLARWDLQLSELQAQKGVQALYTQSSSLYGTGKSEAKKADHIPFQDSSLASKIQQQCFGDLSLHVHCSL